MKGNLAIYYSLALVIKSLPIALQLECKVMDDTPSCYNANFTNSNAKVINEKNVEKVIPINVSKADAAEIKSTQSTIAISTAVMALDPTCIPNPNIGDLINEAEKQADDAFIANLLTDMNSAEKNITTEKNSTTEKKSLSGDEIIRAMENAEIKYFINSLGIANPPKTECIPIPNPNLLREEEKLQLENFLKSDGVLQLKRTPGVMVNETTVCLDITPPKKNSAELSSHQFATILGIIFYFVI